ncbi:hypothetical protein [Nostoc sp.]
MNQTYPPVKQLDERSHHAVSPVRLSTFPIGQRCLRQNLRHLWQSGL